MFSVLGFSPSHHPACGYQAALDSSGLWLFLKLSDKLDSFESTGQIFCRKSLNFGLSDFFFMVSLGFQDYHRGKISFSLHYTMGPCYQHDISLMRLTLITWPWYYLPGFSLSCFLFAVRMKWQLLNSLHVE